MATEAPSAAACTGPDLLGWLACRIELEAVSEPRQAHPLSVFEAIIKGAREEAGITAPMLWHWPEQSAESMRYRPGERITLELQLFTAPPDAAARLQDALRARLAAVQSGRRHFVLVSLTPWLPAEALALPEASAWRLEFHTPLPLPKKGRVERTEVSPEEFLFACRKRVAKLWAVEPRLPPPPEIKPLGWRYWRITHRSRSQNGEPLLLNGCLGQLRLSGEQLPAWRPWLALFVQVGLGERLGFSLGRFTLLAETAPVAALPEPRETPPPRRPLYVERTACKLSLDNENLVLEGGEGGESGQSKERYPLRLLESVQCTSPTLLTTSLLHALGEQDVPLVLCQPGKEALVLTVGQSEYRRGRGLAAHHRAHEMLDEASQTRLAARWVKAKLAAQASLVRSRYQAGDNQLLEEITRAVEALEQCANVAAVRGWEGIVARQYYPWLAARHPELGEWRGRIQRGGAPDALNALLNFGYALLRVRVELAVRAQGLDPFLGVLHAANGRHPALVSDFMEALRARVERLVLRLLGLKQIRPEHLEESAHGIRIASSARQTYVQAFARLAHQTGKGLLPQLEALARSYHEAAMRGALAAWHPEIPSIDADMDDA
jgi:CRISPR-associated endonuclease Cas1